MLIKEYLHKELQMTNITEIIPETKQDWVVTIGNQKKEAPYLVVDNWYTSEEK